jgi:hypothetical protein
MPELAELAAEAQDIALSRFRLLEPHLAQHRSSRQTQEFPFGWRNLFWLLRQIASKDLRHSVLTYSQSQGAFVSKHSTAIQKRRKHP